MRLTIVTGFFLPVPAVSGGATEKIWHRLSQEFAKRGHEVTFVSRQWPGFPNRSIESGVRQIRLPGTDHSRYLPINLISDFIWGLRVAPELPAADITICNNVSLPIWLSSLRPRCGKVVAVVARMPKGQTKFYGRVDRVLSLSKALTDRLLAENPGLAGRIGPFPFPIDWSLHSSLRKPPTSGTVTLSYVGRVHPEKGVGMLLEAADLLASRSQSLPPWRLRITGPVSVPAGGGGETWRDSLLARYGSLAGRLEFLPPEYDPKLLASRYAEADVFVYPSLAEAGETFGVAVAEAMAAGSAPLVSNLECFRDLVIPEKTGLVFDHSRPDSPELLAQALERLVRDADLRRSLAASAQHHSAQFDYEPVASMVLEQFERMLI